MLPETMGWSRLLSTSGVQEEPELRVRCQPQSSTDPNSSHRWFQAPPCKQPTLKWQVPPVGGAGAGGSGVPGHPPTQFF